MIGIIAIEPRRPRPAIDVSGRGFFAALDQSGGSTPGALAKYGIGRDRYNSDAEMFDLVQRAKERLAQLRESGAAPKMIEGEATEVDGSDVKDGEPPEE